MKNLLFLLVASVMFTGFVFTTTAHAESRIGVTHWDGLNLVRVQYDEWFIETNGHYEETSSNTKERVILAGREWQYPLIDEKLFLIGELGAVWHEVKWDRGYKDVDLSGTVSVGLGYDYKRAQISGGFRCGIPGISTNVDDDTTGDSRDLCGPVVSFSVGF